MNEELEERVTEALKKFPALPESVIRMAIADELGVDPGKDLGRGPKPLCESDDFETREAGYKVLDILDDMKDKPGE